MYVGPWQEYKLMRVIEDLRGELNKQQELLQQQQQQPSPPPSQTSMRTATSLPPVSSATTAYDFSPAASASPQMVTRKEKERQDAQQRMRPPYRVYDSLPSDASARGRCVTCNHSHTEDSGGNIATTTNTQNASYGDYVIRDIKAPTYGKNDEQILMQMGLPPLSASNGINSNSNNNNGVQHVLQQHPYVKDLSRRAPLDTEAVSARAGQRFYKRIMAESGNGGTHTQQQQQQQQQPYGAGATMSSTTGKGGADSMDDKRRKKLVERRLRLQALYRAGNSGGGVGADETDLLEDEESDEDDLPPPPSSYQPQPQQQQQQQGDGDEGEITRRFSDPTGMDPGHPYASPIPLLPAAMNSGPPRPSSTTVSPADIFKKAKPPTPKKIEEDDVGGLLDWANQLNDDWMKDM